jgi:hypothetical protein
MKLMEMMDPDVLYFAFAETKDKKGRLCGTCS